MNGSGNLVGIGNRPRESDDRQESEIGINEVNVRKASDNLKSDQALDYESESTENDNQDTDGEKYGFRFYGN